MCEAVTVLFVEDAIYKSKRNNKQTPMPNEDKISDEPSLQIHKGGTDEENT